MNKAMIYYHFENKQGLYVEIVRAAFTAIGQRTAAIVGSNATPEEKVAAFVAAISAEADARSYLAPIMMRETAAGASRLDPETLRLMARVFLNYRELLEQGTREGAFRALNPFFAYLSMISPIIFFRTSRPLRTAMSHQHVLGADELDHDLFLAHHIGNVLRAIHRDSAEMGRVDQQQRRKGSKKVRAGDDT